jgi:formylglycine-generating enzyme required for sulfatase activity
MAHTVTLQSFEIMGTEVTVAQYAECVRAGGCREPIEPSPGDVPTNWNAPGYEAHPVTYIVWQQAVEFCTWAGGRLPSEAEWEYAARSAGLERSYPWGEAVPSCTYAVMREGDVGDEASYGCGTGRTWAVCSKVDGHTQQGLCDMAGNVWEWVQDWYHQDYTGAPSDGTAWESPPSDTRVHRGAGFDSASLNMFRTTNRRGYSPGEAHHDIGVRCARDAS